MGDNKRGCTGGKWEEGENEGIREERRVTWASHNIN